MSENLDPGYAGEGMYKENILDHFRNPRNMGKVKNADIKFSETNPLCGDVITVSLEIKDNKIKDIKFLGSGCAISQAATSMLTEALKGKTLDEIKKMSSEDITKILGIRIGPVRIKCAVLGLIAIKNGIKEYEGKN